jgi:putative membrane protein
MPIVSGVVLGLGCQNESRSTSEPGSAPATHANAPNVQQPAVGSDDANKMKMIFSALHGANQQEISEGKLAADRAQNAEIKKFANEMVSDHTSADQKITDLGKQLDIDVSWKPRDNPIFEAKEEAQVARKKTLSSLSGASFDIVYIAPEADEHEHVLQIIERGQKTASGDAKRLLDELKPTIEAHRDHAKNLLTGFRFEASAVGGGPAGGAHPSMEGSEPSGRNNPAMIGGAKHDAGGGGWKGTPRSGKGAGTGTDTGGNMGSGTSGTRGGGVTGGSTTPPTNP